MTLALAAACAWLYYRDDLAAMAHRQNSVINWALRLPVERRRARLAGFSPGMPAGSAPPAAQNAAPAWELLDAEVRANTPDGKLPPVRDLFRYANPLRRAKQNRKKVVVKVRLHKGRLAAARRAARFPVYYVPYRSTVLPEDEMEIALFFAGLFAVEAVEARRRNDTRAALVHSQTVQKISRQFIARNTFVTLRWGYGLEAVACHIVREGLTDPDPVRRRTWAKRLRDYPELLRSLHSEQSTLPQYQAGLHEYYREESIYFATRRKIVYKPIKEVIPGLIPRLVLWLHRLDFVLEQREVYDALEANLDWTVAGIAVRLRGMPESSRAYDLWSAIRRWDAGAARATEHDHRVFKPYGEGASLQGRLHRDTQRALTQAVLSQVTSAKTPVPDDPFAPKPNTPLRRRNLPGGVVVWYSIGENGKDDNGDFQNDVVARVLPPKL